MLELKVLPERMSDFEVDMNQTNRTLISGCYQEYVQLGDGKRGFVTYIPENIENCQPCIVVAIPSNQDPITFLETTGFKKFADDKQLFVHLITAENGSWNLSGDDADYMNAVYVAIQARDYYVTMQDNIYACGVGDGVDVAQQAARKMTSEWSGLFTMGDIKIGLENDVIKEDGAKEQDDVELKIEAQRCQLPVWMHITEKSECNLQVVDYWKKQNHVTEDYLSGQGADFIWMPSPVRSSSEVNEEQIAQVRISVGKTEFTYNWLEMVWKYIGMARRHRGRAKKNLRYFKDPIACGAVNKSMVVDGIRRIWYEYVPETCTPDEKWPLVVVMHGRGGTAETFFDISCMSNVARERRFIAVFPQAAIHQQKPNGLKNVLLWCGAYDGTPIDDVHFVRTMVDDIKQRLPIDSGRVYACGQSSGGMMTDVLCNCASDIFAACASWSALTSPNRMYADFEETEPLTPTMFIYGDRDFLCVGKEPDPELPYSLDGEIRDTLMKKINKYGLDIKRVQVWESHPITWYCYPNEQGVPMLTVGIVNNMVHANYPEESWISFDQFFCQFSRDEAGTLCYRGHKVMADIR